MNESSSGISAESPGYSAWARWWTGIRRAPAWHNPRMEITWLGHGSFQFRLSSGQVVLMDPWIDGNPAYPKGFEIRRADTICVTHGHFDHIHDVVPLARKFGAEVVAIFESCAWLESKGVQKTRPMNKGGSQKAGEVTLTMTHAVHSCGILDDGKIHIRRRGGGLRAALRRRPRAVFRRRHQCLLRYGVDPSSSTIRSWRCCPSATCTP